MSTHSPLVSICCLTYNHAPFIHQTIEGFLMQKTNFPIEILIHDDCSTDGTKEIVREYETRYPDVLFPIYEEVNQYSNGHQHDMDFFNYLRARGKYIAYCEGDDYWTDPLKLQKQVDFLEDHPEYCVCFHNFSIQYYPSGNIKNKKYVNKEKIINGGVDVTTHMYFHNSYGGQPLTMVFRKSIYNFQWRNQYLHYKDTHEIYHLLNSGKGRYLDFIGGVYTKHNGSATDIPTIASCEIERNDILELYTHNKTDKVLASYLLDVLLWNYDYYKSINKNTKFIKIQSSLFVQVPLLILRLNFIILKRNTKKLIKLFYEGA